MIFTCPNYGCKGRGGVPYHTTRKHDFMRHVRNIRLPCFQKAPEMSLEYIRLHSLPNPFDKQNSLGVFIIPEKNHTCHFCQVKFSKSYYDTHSESCPVILKEIRQVHLSIIKLLKVIKEFGYNFKECDGYIYLLHCQTETTNLGYDVFKVGMTECQPYDRIRRYPGDVQVLKTIGTKNVVEIEKLILSKFRQTYDICQVLRNEYFSGDPCSMMRIINEIIYDKNRILE